MQCAVTRDEPYFLQVRRAPFIPVRRDFHNRATGKIVARVHRVHGTLVASDLFCIFLKGFYAEIRILIERLLKIDIDSDINDR